MQIHVYVFPMYWLTFQLSQRIMAFGTVKWKTGFHVKRSPRKKNNHLHLPTAIRWACLLSCQQWSLVLHVCQDNHRKIASHVALTCSCTIEVNSSSFCMFGIHLNYLYWPASSGDPPVSISLALAAICGFYMNGGDPKSQHLQNRYQT